MMKKKAEAAAAVSAENTKPKAKKAVPAEKKETSAKARVPEKGKVQDLRPEIFVQYQGGEISMDALVEAAKENFHGEKKRTQITGLKMYVKPEEHTAYYVVNDTFEGKVPF